MKQPIKLAILGDVNTDWGWRTGFDAGDPGPIFGDVLPLLQNSDQRYFGGGCPAS